MKNIAIVAMSAALLFACAKEKQVRNQNQPATRPATALGTIGAAALPAGNQIVPAQQAADPLKRIPAPAAAQDSNLTGKVLDTMNAGGYTYVQLASDRGKIWAAVPQFPVKKGETVTVSVQMVMENFESKSLNRKFDRLLFATIPQTNAQPRQAAAMPPGAMGSPSDHMKAAADAGPVNVDKAPGGKTVADVWAMKAVLRDQPVVVRGKVVKFLPEIMGKNWMHLRDGSGSRANGDDDITVTTSEMVKVGDVVTVTGTVRVDKDFGAGYVYPVIIEDAKLKP